MDESQINYGENMEDEKEKILVCYECQFPLLQSFIFAGAENYCLNCGGSTGYLGAGNVIEITDDLKNAQKMADEIFDTISYVLGFGGGSKLQGCTKCFPKGKEGENHIYRLTGEETEAYSYASNKRIKWCRTDFWDKENKKLTKTKEELLED